MAEEQATPPADNGGGGDGGIEQVLQGIADGLAKVNDTLGSSGAPDEAKAAFAAALQSFQEGMEILQNGGQDPGGPSQTTTPEQGANPNAVPMTMGRPG